MVIPPALYNPIDGSAPFVRPVDPGTFTLTVPLGVQAAPLTPCEIVIQKVAFDNDKRIFYEYQAVEATLRNQLIEAIAPECLRRLRNSVTDMLNNSIPDIFDKRMLILSIPGMWKHAVCCHETTINYDEAEEISCKSVLSKIMV